ncbi:GUN4 [Symbiodinium sp. CCMP2592]|nr:GUN4 [Symbiodinium sp. CCMP2592]
MDAMETLWQHYSEAGFGKHLAGRFGFSPQRKIWKKRVRGQFDKFAEEVSWFTDTWKNRNWPDEFIYTLEAPARLSELRAGHALGVGHGEVKLPRLAVAAGAEDELGLGAFTEVGHLPLTNCIRGAQVLEELLSHPAIENRKAAAVKARPTKKSTDDSDSEIGGAVSSLTADAMETVRPARSPRLHTLAAAKSPFDQVPKAVSLDPLLNDQLSSMGQEAELPARGAEHFSIFQAWQISHLLLRAGPAKDFEAP